MRLHPFNCCARLLIVTRLQLRIINCVCGVPPCFDCVAGVTNAPKHIVSCMAPACFCVDANLTVVFQPIVLRPLVVASYYVRVYWSSPLRSRHLACLRTPLGCHIVHPCYNTCRVPICLYWRIHLVRIQSTVLVFIAVKSVCAGARTRPGHA